jgi:hypothetical protein
MTRCPCELELEVHLLGGGPAAVDLHVVGCGRCRSRLLEMQRLGDEFRREVFPATVEAVVVSGVRRRPPGWLFSAVPVSALLVAGILVVVLPRQPYLGSKGGALGFAVFVQGPSGARMATDGEAVPAGAALRFTVRPARPCRLWVVSVDAAAQVSRLYPASGDEGERASPGPLPGGALLDGQPGPERIYAICTVDPLALSAVETAVKKAVPGGDDSVRTASELEGLPAATLQETVLLEKQP